MAEVVQLAKTMTEAARPGDFVMTTTARDILCSLQLVHNADEARFTMIVGRPGCGKTRALQQFQKAENGVAYFAFKSGEAKPSDVSEVMFRRFLPAENPNGKSIPLRRSMLVNQFRGYPFFHRDVRTLLADEAQHMSAEGIEWLRGVVEDAGVSIAFVGDGRLAAMIDPIPQLRSRVTRPVLVTEIVSHDIAEIAACWGVTEENVLRALAAVGKQGGGIRSVKDVLDMASVFAGSASISATHVEAAIVDLKLGGRRVDA